MSGSIFIVTGMPRARTAWLANYLTYRDSLCIHEMLSLFDSPQSCAEFMLNTAAHGQSIGMSDSGAVWFQEALVKALPEARWVVIRRPVPQSERSFLHEHGISVTLEGHNQKIEELIRRVSPPVRIFDFHEIDERIHEIAEFCVPGWPRNPLRDSMLKTFDVKLTDVALTHGIVKLKGSPLMKHLEPVRKESV